MQRSICFLIIGVVFLLQPAEADQIVLKNGDRLTGKIVRTDENGLVFKLDLAGTLTVPLEAIEQISSDQPLYLSLTDGQTIVGSLATEAGQIEVQTAETGEVRITKDAIEAIRSPESQAAYEVELERLRNPGLVDLWSGSADVGLSLSRGNAETANFSLGMNAIRVTPRDKIGVYATSLYATNSTTGDSVTTANAVRGGIRYDANINERVFAFGLTDLEFDEFQMLDLRMVLGGGLGWHARKTEALFLDLFAGGTLNREYFSTGLNRSSGEVMVGQELGFQLSDRTSIKERLVLYPNLSESGEYRLTFDASVVTNINTWLGWHITFSDRYLSNPVLGTKSNDILLTTGLRLTFGR